MKKLQTNLFCAGFGYVARNLARLPEFEGVKILATARSEEKAQTLRSRGITPVLMGEGGEYPAIPAGTAWLISAPPDANGCPIYRAFGAQAATAGWIGYLSTTGVYGDLGGNWAFEWTDVKPESERGRRRVLAEEAWRGSGAHLFRLPGIYGPGRSAFDRLEAGDARRIVKQDQVFSRAHVQDIASSLAASIARPHPGRVYHPVDDEPAPPQDVIEYAAKLAGYPVPPAIPIEIVKLSPMARSFYDECKRISNARTKSELGWVPKYATYREGLKAIYAQRHSS